MDTLKAGGTSTRACRFLNPPLQYVVAQVESYGNQFSEKNESGSIPLAIAENKLMATSMHEKIQSFKDYSIDVLHYTSGSGMPACRTAVAEFLSSQVFCLKQTVESIDSTIDPSNLVLSTGCGGLLHQLSIILFEENDAVLIPTPYYPAFDHDFWDLGSVYVGEVNSPDGAVTSALTRKALDSALERSTHPVKALLLSNPNNPLGTVYSSEELYLAVTWCRENKLHLICDEIYALSVFDGSINFISVVELLENDLGDDVHVLWGLSKDFGASGLRLGVCYSQNKSVVRALGCCNDAFQVSNLVQEWTRALLVDQKFTSDFIRENRRLLAQSHDFLEQGLREIGIPIVPSCAGIFVFVNLRSFLAEDTFEAEEALTMQLISIGIIMTPGKVCHCPQPGYFRLCFAWVPYSSLVEAVRRLGHFAAAYKGPRLEQPANADGSGCVMC